jgi:hypothetical protein
MRRIWLAIPLLGFSLTVLASSNRETIPPPMDRSYCPPYSGGISPSDNLNSIMTQIQNAPYNHRLSVK